MTMCLTDFFFFFDCILALSATGHVSYMIVRLGPVFRIGSMYMSNEAEKKSWQNRSDYQKLCSLLSGEYPWFALEIGLLAVVCIYFIYLRLTTYGIMEEHSCLVV